MVSLVIPNFNGAHLLEKNLPKIEEALALSNKKAEIIVVDDASSDGSVNYIKNQILSIRQAQDKNIKNTDKKIEIKLLQNEKNMGFSSTVNRGVGRATGEIVILLNTDAYPQKDFLRYLLPHFEDERIFAVGCMDKSVEDGKHILRGRGLGKWERGFLAHRRGNVDREDTLWVSGGSGVFRKW